MKYWLLKSEPQEFSIDDLKRVGEQVWDGVRNYQVRNSFRDIMKSGDKALFYHSSCKEVGVVGEMEIVSPAEVDPTQFDKKSKYYDSKSNKDAPRWLGADGRFKDMILLRAGNRLSAFQVTKTEYNSLVKLGK